MDLLWLRGDGPKDVPTWAYVYLVNTLKVTPENLIGLLSVQKVGFWEDKLVTFIRIYKPSAIEGALQVKKFASLDEHPELILYEGYWEKTSGRVLLECRAAPKPKSQ
jgi:hypothetical protein